MTKWTELITRFQKLSEITGNDKATSYEVKICVDLYVGWELSLGTYDIADWPRHTILSFKDEESALKRFEDIILGAEKVLGVRR